MIMTTNKVVGSSKVPCVGADNTSNSMAAAKKNQPRQRRESRKDTSTIKEGNNLPRTGAASNTLSLTAIINQKLMKIYYRMSKFHQVRKRINMISLFDHYKDVTAETKVTPIERLTIESFRVPSKDGVGKLELSIVPTKIAMGKMEVKIKSNHNYMKLPEPGRSNDNNNYTAGML